MSKSSGKAKQRGTGLRNTLRVCRRYHDFISHHLHNMLGRTIHSNSAPMLSETRLLRTMFRSVSSATCPPRNCLIRPHSRSSTPSPYLPNFPQKLLATPQRLLLCIEPGDARPSALLLWT
ncbi:hypothetical protein MRB53_040703 [Persea americana]|nr:hypothetical protein MRB53_040703 [Persea americana]